MMFCKVCRMEHPEGVLPPMAGGDFPPPTTGGSASDTERLIGQRVVLNDGRVWTVIGVNGNTVKFTDPATGNEAIKVLPNTGALLQPDGTIVRFDSSGNVQGRSQATEAEKTTYFNTGTFTGQSGGDAPISAEGLHTQDIGGGVIAVVDKDGNVIEIRSGGGGGGGRGPVVAGAAAPDPAGALNALANYYATQVEADQIPFNQAVQEFNRWAGIVGLQQEQSSQELQRAQGIETGQREREIARGQIQLGAQGERTSRASDLRQMLRSSIPTNVNLNVPLLGNISQLGTQVNPDQFYDIAGLNAIQLPNANVAPALQNYQPFNVNAAGAPTLPQTAPTASPISMQQALDYANRAAQGFSGWVY